MLMPLPGEREPGKNSLSGAQRSTSIGHWDLIIGHSPAPPSCPLSPEVVHAAKLMGELRPTSCSGGEGGGEGCTSTFVASPLTPTLSPKKYLIQDPTDGHADTTSWEREPGKNWLAELSEAKHWSLGFGHWDLVIGIWSLVISLCSPPLRGENLQPESQEILTNLDDKRVLFIGRLRMTRRGFRDGSDTRQEALVPLIWHHLHERLIDNSLA